MTSLQKRVLEQAAALGSKASTVNAAARYVRTHRTTAAAPKTRERLFERWNTNRRLDAAKVGDVFQFPLNVRGGYRCVAFADDAAASRAADAIGRCGQKSNYSGGSAQIGGPAHRARWEEIRYKGQFSGYTGSMLYQDYQSCIAASPSGKSALIVTECVVVRRFVAPVGLLFHRDSNGVFLRRVSDSMDYHPTPDDWRAKDFITRVRSGMAKNFTARMVAKKAQRETDRLGRLYQRQSSTCRVTLADSRRAGNCVEGSLRFAERKLHVTREQVLDAQWLMGFDASHLRSVANGDSAGVERAVRAAWMRETTVSI